jgi:two-component system cell cycle sensor histidine kinase/response regulator CckA
MNEQPQYILVVDDIPNILELMETALKFKGGYRVGKAVNGLDALEAIRREKPDLVITDILMPKMDGFSLVHQLRLAPETRNIPVIFLSATYIAPEDKNFAVLIGATRFIEKPIDIDLLMKTIGELLVQEKLEETKPIRDFEFYEEYRKRLKIKLEQKVKQIARTERLVPTITEDEQKAFLLSLQANTEERDEIQLHLNEVEDRIAAWKKSQEQKSGDSAG